MELNPDFQEFLRSFVEHDVRFLIIGGYALAVHGHLATGRLRDQADAADLATDVDGQGR
jgi:hypothetical protein